MQSHKIIRVFMEYLSELAQVKMEWGVRGEGWERERERQINGVRDGALVRNRNGAGQKWLLVKLYTWIFLSMQIKITNKLSLKLGRVRILRFILVPQHSFSWQHVLPQQKWRVIFCTDKIDWEQTRANSIGVNFYKPIWAQ
jgi:hypothetical protein